MPTVVESLQSATAALVAATTAYNASRQALADAIALIRDGNLPFQVDIGTPSAMVVTYPTPHLALTPGLHVRVRAAHNCTGPSTVKVDGLPAMPIRRPNGAAELIQLLPTDYTAGAILDLVYDHLNGSFQLLSSSVARGSLLFLTAPIAIPSGVATLVNWHSAVPDAGYFAVANTFRCKIPAGVRRFRAVYQSCFEAAAAGSRKSRILLDGVHEGNGLPAGRVPAASAADVTLLQGAGAIYDLGIAGLAADGTHYLNLEVTQDSGAPVNLRAVNTWLHIEPVY